MTITDPNFPLLDNLKCLLPILQNPTAKFEFSFPNSSSSSITFTQEHSSSLPESLFMRIPQSFGSFSTLRRQFELGKQPKVQILLHQGAKITGVLEFFDQKMNLFLADAKYTGKQWVRSVNDGNGERKKEKGNSKSEKKSSSAKRRRRIKWKQAKVECEWKRIYIPGLQVVAICLVPEAERVD